jgi:hypothetical protein
MIGRVCLARPPTSPGFLNLLTLSSAPSLPALFHAGCAHGVRPSELCSSRAAVRRLQRLCPLDVGTLRASPRFGLTVAGAEAPRRSRPYPNEEALGAPRLQGFAPHESPPLRAGCLGRQERVALQGFLPSRVFPLTGMASAFAAPPLMWLPPSRTGRSSRPTSGSRYPVRLARLLRDRRPSWGFPPRDLPRQFGLGEVRESPPRAPGCVTVP